MFGSKLFHQIMNDPNSFLSFESSVYLKSIMDILLIFFAQEQIPIQ